jgi:aryl-alcohol dehydrogenase-like predicted oxidoreductase
MAAAEGMGLVPWGALGGGKFKTAAQREELANSGNPGRKAEPQAVDLAVSKVLESVASRHNTAITSVALAYLMHKAPYVTPLVGGRKPEHLLGNIEALGLRLSEQDIKEIEGAYEFDVGFPTTFLFPGENKEAHPGNVVFTNAAANFDFPDLVRPIVPKKLDE